jgi:hypothetical protein
VKVVVHCSVLLKRQEVGKAARVKACLFLDSLCMAQAACAVAGGQESLGERQDGAEAYRLPFAGTSLRLCAWLREKQRPGG